VTRPSLKLQFVIKAFAVVLCIAVVVACGKKEIDQDRIVMIGQEITSLNSQHPEDTLVADVVEVGKGLKEQLKQLQTHATQYTFEVKTGDLDKPYGDGSADCILIIHTGNDTLALRLRYNDTLDKFDILGWTTKKN
jgi:hypothetical protein